MYTTSETITYQNGRKHGAYSLIEEDDDYKTIEKGSYKNDVKHGTYEKNENIGGIITSVTGNYKSGKKHGVWIIEDKTLTTFKEDGSEYRDVSKEYYKDGELIKKEKVLVPLSKDK